MPPGLVTIILVSVIAGVSGFIAVTKIIINHLERRHSLPADSSLTQSELRAMISSAVEEATSPIAAEMESLRKRLPRPGDVTLLPEHRESGDGDS